MYWRNSYFSPLCQLLHDRLLHVHGKVAVNALFHFFRNIAAATLGLILHPVVAPGALKKEHFLSLLTWQARLAAQPVAVIEGCWPPLQIDP